MFVKIYKDFWLTGPRWLHYITEFADKNIINQFILAWWRQVCGLCYILKNIKFSPMAKRHIGGVNILAVGRQQFIHYIHVIKNVPIPCLYPCSWNTTVTEYSSRYLYWYRVYPVYVNANPVPQKMYRIEVIVIQKFLNEFNDLNSCLVVTFKYQMQDR